LGTALVALAVVTASPQARGLEWKAAAQPAGSLAFVVHEMGVPVDGVFKRFTAQFHLDPAKPAEGRAELDIDLTSIDTGNDEANSEVAGKKWFDTRSHPHATFHSTAVKALGPGRYEVRGTMEIKGRTREIALPVALTAQGTQGAFDGVFELHRADFAIGEGEWAEFGTVANEIQVKFHFPASAGK
jgi:polyisoprenoid-binding protein YceI